eukprot:4876323-Prymnesium_polylepis.1
MAVWPWRTAACSADEPAALAPASSSTLTSFAWPLETQPSSARERMASPRERIASPIASTAIEGRALSRQVTSVRSRLARAPRLAGASRLAGAPRLAGASRLAGAPRLA